MSAPVTPRKASASSTKSTASSTPSTSTFSSPTSTRSDGCPFSPGIVFDRKPSSPLPNANTLYVVVKLADPFKLDAIAGSTVLPSRPPKRPLLARLGTRLFGPKDTHTYKAIKMPRSAYNAHFRRDARRNYIESEAEREWTEEELMAEFGEFQDQPLGKVGLCAI
ncbi:hypothetical protein LTR78_003827 [Recurvomyces mirabilis]|uniref:Uncharacterized protein n=1 Tax=Recurvomyces mirabilis TaxID=574656 RepID=A0AAE0WR99_9PEZI|nr:hypothetical protein LTR78_003827 [Recurvomyces mirabilis]KAK5154939.1 hypothetical protein LTS14_006520 [Recurvomyces mirabilis]